MSLCNQVVPCTARQSGKGRLVAFGELLLRLNTPEGLRFVQADNFVATFAGAEANVAVSVANFGHDASFVSALPVGNPLAERALRELAFWGVSTAAVAMRPGRMGTYFLESAGGIRPAAVVYDRAHSVFAESSPSAYDWPELLAGAEFLHLTGITPALGEPALQAMRQAMDVADRQGVRLCFDVNDRRSLWTRETARATLPGLAARAGVLVASMYQVEDLFGIPTPGFDESALAGTASALARATGVPQVVVTCRKSLAGRLECRCAAVCDGGKTAVTPVREYPVVEPLGGGDAFCGGLLARLMDGATLLESAAFGDAAAALKYGISGDFNKVSREEVFSLLASGPGTVRR